MIDRRFAQSFSPRWGCAVLVLAFAMPAAAQPEPKAVDLTPLPKKYAQEYTEPFTGKTENSPDWMVIGPVGERDVRFEPAGLRIILPTGFKGDRPGTGVRTRFRVKGDFEITVSFEILKEPEQADAGTNAGTRLNLGVIKDVPTEDVATVGRAMWPTNGRRFVGWSSMWDAATNKMVPHSLSRPAKAMTGRLRLVRSGADLHYAFSNGLDGGFQYFKKFPFGAEDLLQVRIVGATSGEKADLDVRVTDFRLRADSIPDMPAALPAVVPVPGAAVAQAENPAAPPANRGWLMAALLIGTAVVLVFAIVLAAGFLLLRARGGGGQETSAEKTAGDQR